MKADKWKSGVTLFLSGMVVFHVLVLWQLRTQIAEGFGDFTVFNTAGKLVLHGQARQMYDPETQWLTQREFASEVQMRNGPLLYVRPPFEAVLFAPFCGLSFPAAWAAWTVVKLALLFAIPFLLKPYIQPMWFSPPLAGFFSLGFFPVSVDLLHGQDSILYLFILVLCFRALRQSADLRAGMFLGLGLIKFHLVLPIALLFLLRGKWRVVAGFLLAGVALLLVSTGLMGWAGVASYPQYLWDFSNASGVGVSAWQMPNVRALLAACAQALGHPQHLAGIVALAALLGVVFVAWLWRSADDDPQSVSIGFSLAIVISILFSYYAYPYDLTALLLPLMVLSGSFIHDAELRGYPRTIFLTSAILLGLSPLFWILLLRSRQFYWVGFLAVFLMGIALTLAMWRERNAGSHAA